MNQAHVMSKVTSGIPAIYMHQGEKADMVEGHKCLSGDW